MLLVGMNSWIQSSTGTVAQQPAARTAKSAPRTGVLRAGVAIALVALALLAGTAHPAETSAKKSTSYTCTTLESAFNATSKAYEVAVANGMTDKANLYLNTTFWLQGIYLDLNCSFGPADLGDAT